MCNPASFVVTKNGVFWSKGSESHERIIEEHGLHADGVRGPNVARVELSPPEWDFTRPIEEWNFTSDQDRLPDWWNYEEALERVREVVRSKWLPSKVIMPDQEVRIVAGRHLVRIYGHVDTVENSIVDEIAPQGSVLVLLGSMVTNRVHGTIQQCLRSNINVLSGRIDMVERSMIHYMCGYSRIRVVENGSTIHTVSDSAHIGLADSGTSIGTMECVSRLTELRNGTVRLLRDQATIELVSGRSAVLAALGEPRVLQADDEAIVVIEDSVLRPKMFGNAVLIDRAALYENAQEAVHVSY